MKNDSKKKTAKVSGSIKQKDGKTITDPQGMYTGVCSEGFREVPYEKPVQDADDL